MAPCRQAWMPPPQPSLIPLRWHSARQPRDFAGDIVPLSSLSLRLAPRNAQTVLLVGSAADGVGQTRAGY